MTAAALADNPEYPSHYDSNVQDEFYDATDEYDDERFLPESSLDGQVNMHGSHVHESLDFIEQDDASDHEHHTIFDPVADDSSSPEHHGDLDLAVLAVPTPPVVAAESQLARMPLPIYFTVAIGPPDGATRQISAFMDTGSPFSTIRLDIARGLHLSIQRTTQKAMTIDGSTLTIVGQVEVQLGMPDDLTPTLSTIFVIRSSPIALLIGRRELAQLPTLIKLDDKSLFVGFRRLMPPRLKPTLDQGEGIEFGPGVPVDIKQEFTEMLRTFADHVYEWSGALGLFKEHVLKLDVTDEIPVAAPQFRTPFHHSEPFKKILAEYRSRGIIEPSNSPYSSPAFLVPKKVKPGSSPQWRLVEDYRKVNQKIKPIPYPIPTPMNLIERIGPGKKFYVLLDMASGYHNVPLATSSRKLTAFMTPEGLMQYVVLPFGFHPAPMAFQRTLESILHEHLGRYCLVYIDDILIFADNIAQLLQYTAAVIRTLTQAGGCLKIVKCVFVTSEIDYLGHHVTPTGISPTASSVRAIQDYPRPTSIKALQSFLGMATYLRRHVPGFATLEKALRRAIPASGTRLQWNADAEQAFLRTKEVLSSPAHLAVFDPSKKLKIMADASGMAVGAVLLQGTSSVIGEGDEEPIEYASRVLTDYETRYNNTERELTAAVWAVTKKFRYYVEGTSFTLGTDHKALLGDTKLAYNTTRIVTLKMKLASFSFTWQHVPGRKMCIADALSRAIPRHVVSAVQSVAKVTDDEILQVHRDLGHPGWKKVWHHLGSGGLQPNVQQRCKQLVRGCKTCLTFNPPTRKVGGDNLPITSSGTNDLLLLDILNRVQVNHITRTSGIILLDHYSRYAWWFQTRRTRTRDITLILTKFFSQHGSFLRLTTDPASQFTATAFETFITQYGMQHHLGSSANFRATSPVERLVLTIKTTAAKILEDRPQVPDVIAEAVRLYNMTMHTAIGQTPQDVRFQRKPVILKEKPTKGRPFQVGDTVVHVLPRPSELRHAADRHFLPRKRGPGVITHRLPFNRFRIRTSDGEFDAPSNQLSLFTIPSSS